MPTILPATLPLKSKIGVLSQSFPPCATYTEDDIPDLTGKVVIVTGSNTGIGKECARVNSRSSPCSSCTNSISNDLVYLRPFSLTAQRSTWCVSCAGTEGGKELIEVRIGGTLASEGRGRA